MDVEVQNALDKKFDSLEQKLADALKDGASKADIKKIHDDIEAQGTAIEEFMADQKRKVLKTVGIQFKEFLNTNEDKISDLHKAGSGNILFVPKVPEDITTESGTNAEVPSRLWHDQLGGFNYRDDSSLIALATVSSTSSPLYSYTEMLPKDGDYTFVAEGGTKPQIDFTWENRFAAPSKAAAHEILTEEAVTDIVRMEATAKDYLVKRHGLHKARSIYFADGTGENPTGATVYGRTFVATDLTDIFPLGESNFMDVVNAIITDIYRTQAFEDQAPYMPNVVLINPIDFFIQLVGAKDSRGLPLYPQAGLFNEVRIGGVVIRPWLKIPVGKIFVADMKMYNVINYIPFSIRIGWIDDQFITNKFTMVGESRYFAFVKNLDQAAFVYDDIATVQDAITSAT